MPHYAWSITKVMFVASWSSCWSCLILHCYSFLPLFLYVVGLPLYISSCHHVLLFLTIVLILSVCLHMQRYCHFCTFLVLSHHSYLLHISPLYMGLFSLLLPTITHVCCLNQLCWDLSCLFTLLILPFTLPFFYFYLLLPTNSWMPCFWCYIDHTWSLDLHCGGNQNPSSLQTLLTHQGNGCASPFCSFLLLVVIF